MLICCTVSSVLIVLTLIPTAVRKVKFHKCLDSLIWYTAFWSQVAFAISFVLIILNLAIGAIVTVQLLRTVKLDRDERIAASRVVYYLAASTLIMVSSVPTDPTHLELTFPAIRFAFLGTAHICSPFRHNGNDGYCDLEPIRLHLFLYASCAPFKCG